VLAGGASLLAGLGLAVLLAGDRAADGPVGRRLAGIADSPPAVQQELVAWLARSGADDVLAGAVERCTASFPAGWFVMGSDEGRTDEQPVHRVFLDAFRLDRYEVTNAQYARFVAATGRRPPAYWTGSTYPAGEAGHPVVAVGWADAAAYCAWAGRRLPTEAEWERACRGTADRRYPWGNAWDPVLVNVAGGQPLGGTAPGATDPAWDLLASPQPAGTAGPRPVGSFPGGATPEGVQDLAGNAAEWVADWYSWGGYAGLPARNPVAAGPPWNHVLRGVSWLDRYGRPDAIASDARCAARSSSHAIADLRFGFRCAADDTAGPSGGEP
jgi:formylglycine-generating enzyme required for sulfatase activity